MTERFINPFTDFGFKKIFGEEANKDLLIDFLNELLPDKGPIASLTYLKSEHLGGTETDRKAIFDLYCQTNTGERFIVELQKARQQYFKDRSLYYTTFAIQEQAKKGDWDYKLQGVYTVAIMDFTFQEDGPPDKFRHDIQLLDIETKSVFFNKLRFTYLEMPKFTKTLDELETHYDRWLYVLKNLSRLDEIPESLRERIFLKLFKTAEIATYTPQEQYAYQDSMKAYRDMRNVIQTAVDVALLERNTELVLNAIQRGFDDRTIAAITNLTVEQVQAIRTNTSQ